MGKVKQRKDKPNATRGAVTGSKARRNVGGKPASRSVRIRELVPQAVCGPRTRVQRVFRVDERLNGSSQTHLVFNDRHGWYCEHGTDCPAVGEVRKSGSSKRPRRLDWTTNGRMRE